MRFSLSVLVFLIATGPTAAANSTPKDRETRPAIAWCYVHKGRLELERKVIGRKTTWLSLDRGALLAVLRTESKNGRERALVRVTDLSTLNPIEGWVDSGQAEIIPLDRFPTNQELLRQLGSDYQDDFSASKVKISRWLVQEGDSGAALVCLLASVALPVSRLVVFLPAQGNFTRGPWLEFPFSEMKPGIVSCEVRDLFGDGLECLITHEPFRKGPEVLGVNCVIRRLEGDKFRTLWTAPLEYRNLEIFPAEPQIRQPVEKNVGAPGTVTKAEVEFQPRGKISIPVWKATVEFHAVGRDKPMNSVKVTKACTWNGSEFEAVQ